MKTITDHPTWTLRSQAVTALLVAACEADEAHGDTLYQDGTVRALLALGATIEEIERSVKQIGIANTMDPDAGAAFLFPDGQRRP